MSRPRKATYKAARDAVRIFGKTDAEIDQILAMRKVDSTLLVPSPISGRIVARSAAPGFLTQPGNAPAPYSVADMSTMWMIANVIETDAPAYKLGQEVEVTVPAYPDKVFKGHVTALGSMIDPNTHRQLVRSEIDDPEHLLRSGMYASFVIRVGDPVRSLAVPSNGVVREGDGTMTVWVTSRRPPFRQADRQDRPAAGWLGPDTGGSSSRRNRRHGWRGVSEQQALVGRCRLNGLLIRSARQAR